MGTICPGGPDFWGQEVGDQKSGDQMGSGPNESQPYFGMLRRAWDSYRSRCTNEILWNFPIKVSGPAE